MLGFGSPPYVDVYELYLMIFDSSIHMPEFIEHIKTPHHPNVKLHDFEKIRASNKCFARCDMLLGATNPSMVPS